MTTFANRVILITGAGSGIGRALAKRLAAEGARIAALDLQADALAAMARECPDGAWAVADVTNRLALNQAVAVLAGKLGPVDILIASAGVAIETRALAFNPADFETIVRVNLIGVANSIAAVLPGMLQRPRGHLVALSSLASFRGMPALAGYSASKAGLNALMDSIRCEVSGHGIAATTVCPGFIRTPMTAPLEGRGLAMMDVDYAVDRIVQAMRKRKRFVAFPSGLARQLRIINHLPRWLADRWLVNMRSGVHTVDGQTEKPST